MTAPAAPPLAGLVVLDLTRLLPGPVATMHLADLGAEVIKIEEPAGDAARGLGPRPPGGGDGYLFRMVNRNKRSLVLDLKCEAGAALLRRLAADADVLVEGFRPGVMERLGLGWEALAAANPRLVYVSITGYGQDGPWRERAGHDINYLATSGVLDQTGVAGGPPALSNLQAGDLLGGALAPLVALLAALLAARATGLGRRVDVAMTDALLAHALLPMAAELGGGAAARGEDLLTGALPCYGVHRTADGRYLALGALEAKFWQRLCAVLGRPDFVPLGLAGGGDGARVRAELAAIFAARPLAEWEAAFAAADCCVTPVLTPAEALAHPQLHARGMVVEVAGMRQLAPPWKISGVVFPPPRPAPALGGDGTALLAGRGFTAEEIAALAAAGAFGSG